MKTLSIVLITILLAGCSNLLTSKQNVNQFYTLNAATQFPEAVFDINETIVVNASTASAGLNTDRIILRTSAQRFDYYAGARWNAMLPALVEQNVIQSMENSRNLARVASSKSGVSADYVLMLDIRDFQAEYADPKQAPEVFVRLVGKLIAYPGRELAATFSVQVRQPAQQNNLADVMVAFDQAFTQAQELLVYEMLDYFVEF